VEWRSAGEVTGAEDGADGGGGGGSRSRAERERGGASERERDGCAAANDGVSKVEWRSAGEVTGAEDEADGGGGGGSRSRAE